MSTYGREHLKYSFIYKRINCENKGDELTFSKCWELSGSRKLYQTQK